jgi:hypothetical protein
MRDLGLRLRSLRYCSTAAAPDLDAEYTVLDLSNERDSRAAAERYAITIETHRPGNLLFVHRQGSRLPFPSRFHFNGENNTIILDRDCAYHGSMTFEADDNLALLLGGQGQLSLDATLYAGDTLVCGRGVTMWGVRIWVQGGTVCTISDGCLFSENISIRTTDHHSVIDLKTWEQVNRPADVTIGRHVWIGPNCRISKGVEIGDGAILAADSVLTASMPSAELWGGAPAKLIRKDVSWVVSHPLADKNDIAALRDLLASARRRTA